MEIQEKEGNFSNYISGRLAQAAYKSNPGTSAASEGLQDRQKYNTSSIYIVNTQKRPDVHKIVLFIKLRSPPKKSQF